MFYFSRIKLSFSSTFPGKNTIFKAKLKIKHFLSTPLKFKHFSRPVTTQLTKVFYTYGPNFVILAWTGDELLCGQASAYRTHRRTDGRTDGHTDAGNDNTRRPKLASGKNESGMSKEAG